MRNGNGQTEKVKKWKKTENESDFARYKIGIKWNLLNRRKSKICVKKLKK